jgi:predicted transcriptional regulator
MAKSTKVTFTLDDDTVARIERTAARLGVSKSGLVREAVREYAARIGKLSEAERRRMLEVFDAVVARIPKRTAEHVDRELGALRWARRGPGRRTRPEHP